MEATSAMLVWASLFGTLRALGKIDKRRAVMEMRIFIT